MEAMPTLKLVFLNMPVGILKIMPHPVFEKLKNHNQIRRRSLPVLICRQLSAYT
jgi:hypothetical protein